MLKVLTVAQIRQIEADADAAGVSYAELMERAGRAIAERAIVLLADRPQPKVTILVGTGNNGGDGLVAGRWLAQMQSDALVRYYVLSGRADPDPVLQAAQDAGLFIANAADDRDRRLLRNMVASADLVIDAIFGIGARLPLTDEASKVVRGTRQALNERAAAMRDRYTTLDPAATDQTEHPPKTLVLAVDCPSGLDCDTGKLDANALIADETITFIGAKPGLLLFPGAGAVGRLRVAKLDLPEGIALLDQAQHTLLDADTARAALPARPVDGHKGTFGRAIIVAGSAQYSGAAALAAQAAYRSGAGLVTVASPPSVIGVLAAGLHEPTWLPLSDDYAALRQALGNCEALLFGPGVGQSTEAMTLLQEILKSEALPPMVIDADGLTLLGDIGNRWQSLPDMTILTPHPGEMARLCNIDTAAVQANRPALALEKAAEWKVIVILKGAHTLIATPDGKLTYSPFKTDALATAGTGDVLAGVIAGLLAQGAAPDRAAVLGVYLQGLAGVLAAQTMGSTRSVIAGDVLRSLPAALALLAKS
ncbi:MAG: NAD(P)H-hydrate dehydratase [Armatimonadetes bacterium]|nr:NAD(P)H-hydrate dehydratase [Anaerolineae bacterium]